MATARKKAAETMAMVDVVIEVLDARIPGASTNPMIAELRRHRQRPSLKILNKADAADPTVTAMWLREYGGETDVKAIAVSCKRPTDVAKIPAQAASLAPHRDRPDKPVRLMIMGIPNVGKSTLINALLKRRVAKTGDQPAITKQQSRHQLNSRMELIDTPGLMWPKIEFPADGLMLAASHAIGENAYIDEEVAAFLGETLLVRYPGLLVARYGCKIEGLDGPGLIEAIAHKRGLRSKGGGTEYQKAALILLNDYRSGALGRVSLESPQSRQEMISAARESVAEQEKGPGSIATDAVD